jgi:hypothetical protein
LICFVFCFHSFQKPVTKNPDRPRQIYFLENGYFNHGRSWLYAGSKAYYFVYPGNSRVVHWFDGPQFLVVILGWLPPGPTPMA